MITIDDARSHLREDQWSDSEIRHKFAEAAALVYAYIGTPQAPLPYDLVKNYPDNADASAAYQTEAADWQNRGIDAAILLVLGELWANRESSTADPLSPAVKNLLSLYRPVVFA